MLRACSPRMGLRHAMQLRAEALQLYRGAQHTAPSTRYIQTVSLLDFKVDPRESIGATRPCSRRPWRLAQASAGVRNGGVSYFSTGQLPQQVSSVGSPETTSFLRNNLNGAEIHIIGTAHISTASAEEVRQMIRRVRPDTVFLELDAERAARLQARKHDSLFEFLKRNLPGIFIPGPQWGSNVLTFGIGSMYQLMRMLGADPGIEFKAAIEEAMASGARIVYGDVPFSVTSQRLAAKIGIRDVIKFAFLSEAHDPKQEEPLQQQRRQQPQAHFRQDKSGSTGGSSAAGQMQAQVEAMKTRKAASAMRARMQRGSPHLAAVLVDERDQYMVDQLRRLTGKVVAVVGLAHLDGIEEKWKLLDSGAESCAP